VCYETLYNDEELHMHHILAKKQGGKDTPANLVLLHEICHRQIHTVKIDQADMRNRISNLREAGKKLISLSTSETVVEPGREPYAGRLASTVHREPEQ